MAAIQSNPQNTLDLNDTTILPVIINGNKEGFSVSICKNEVAPDFKLKVNLKQINDGNNGQSVDFGIINPSAVSQRTIKNLQISMPRGTNNNYDRPVGLVPYFGN